MKEKYYRIGHVLKHLSILREILSASVSPHIMNFLPRTNLRITMYGEYGILC